MAGKSYDVTTKLMLNDGMSKGLKKVLDHVNKVNTALERMSGLGDGLDNVYRGTVDMATGANVANEAFKKLDTTMKSVSGTKIPSMTPKITGSATVPLSAGSGLEKSVGVIGKLKSGYQKLVDYSAKLDKNSIGFFRNLRYSMLNTYILIQGLKSVGRVLSGILESSDAFVNSLARLNLANSMMNDGLYTTRNLQREIYDAAERSRMAYGDMVDFVSDMTLQAGHAFKNQKEILKFSELIQKSFKASGTSIQSQVAGLYQLKQALASNRLQGDEFRSIIENMPQLTNMLNASLGTTHAELKKLSSEGALTSEVIKQAVFDNEELINKMFSAMPKTFGDTMVHLKNVWDNALWEFKERFNIFLNSEIGTELIDTMTGKLERLGEILNKLMHYLPKVVEWLRKMTAVVKDNSGFILMVIGAIMLQKSLMEALNSIIKIITVFSKFSWIAAIVWAIAFAIAYWVYSMWEAGMSFEEIASTIINKINDIYNFLLPAINMIKMVIDVLIESFRLWSEAIEQGSIWVHVLNAALIAAGFAALFMGGAFEAATMPMAIKVMLVVGAVLLLLWAIGKIAPIAGYAIGYAIGWLVGMWNTGSAVAEALVISLGGAFGLIGAAALEMVGTGLVAFGDLLSGAGDLANGIANALIEAFNWGIRKVNDFLDAMAKLPGVGALVTSWRGTESGPANIGVDWGSGSIKAGESMIAKAEGIQSDILGAIGDAWSNVDTVAGTIGDTAREFAEAGANIGQGVQDFLNAGKDLISLPNFNSDVGKYSLTGPWEMDLGGNGPDSEELPGGGAGGGGGGGSGGKPNIGTVDKVNEVDLSDSTMKLLKAMYERDLFQRFVNIDSSMQFSFVGTAEKEEDAKDIAANVDRIVAERLANLLIT